VAGDLVTLTNQYGIAEKYIPSSNAYLSTILLVPAAPLTPAFDKDVFEYTVELPAGTESVTVNAFPVDFTATFTGTGTVDVSSGSATVEIVVTAEDEITVLTYTINFIVGGVGIDEALLADLQVIYNSVENSLNFINIDNVERVEIFSITGTKLYVQENISSGKMYLNSANLQNNAVYVAQIYAGDKFSVFKFVKLNN
jgi:hypothetical protein